MWSFLFPFSSPVSGLIVYLSLVSTYHIQLHTYEQFKKIHRPILYRITRDFFADRFKINMSLHIHVIKYENIFHCDIFQKWLVVCRETHAAPLRRHRPSLLYGQSTRAKEGQHHQGAAHIPRHTTSCLIFLLLIHPI